MYNPLEFSPEKGEARWGMLSQVMRGMPSHSCKHSTFYLRVLSPSHLGTEEFFDPTADASCMNTYTKRDHVFAKLNLQLQRGTVTLSQQEPGTPPEAESAFMQLEFSGAASGNADAPYLSGPGVTSHCSL